MFNLIKNWFKYYNTACIIIRGLPGSGKTTWANKQFSDKTKFLICSADKFFEKDGTYLFDTNKIKDAHLWCLSEAKRAKSLGLIPVIDNTNTMTWESAKYVLEFEKFNSGKHGKNILFYEIKRRGESIHNIPPDVMEKMENRWEKKDAFLRVYPNAKYEEIIPQEF